MGAEGSCSKICNVDKTLQIKNQDIQQSTIKLKCQLCRQQLDYLKFKNHLDIVHYAKIIPNQNPLNNLGVSCLLCMKQSQNLPKHQEHLSHHKILSQPNRSQIISDVAYLNSKVKESVKQYTGQYTIISQTKKGTYLVTLQNSQNEQFQMIVYENQYQTLKYDKEMAIGDLIWSNLFNIYRYATYYQFTHQPLSKTILAKGLIFINRNPTSNIY